MKSVFWLEQIPLWGVFFLTTAIVLVSIWFGTFLGQRRRRKADRETESSLGTIIAAMLGLLAFLLAFTFGIAAELFQSKRQLLLNEVNAIGTTYLRADLLSEPHRSQIRKLLREYVDIRVNLAREGRQKLVIKLQEAISRSEVLQDQMWSHAVAAAGADQRSVMGALFIASLNEMIDLQTSRLTVFKYHIPPIIWYSLCFIAVVSMGTVGYQVGLSDKSIIRISIVLALTFSAVIFLIADLDRSTEGHLQVNQQPMFELQKQMQMPSQQTNQK
jgi:hypothetical protein